MTEKNILPSEIEAYNNLVKLLPPNLNCFSLEEIKIAETFLINLAYLLNASNISLSVGVTSIALDINSGGNYHATLRKPTKDLPTKSGFNYIFNDNVSIKSYEEETISLGLERMKLQLTKYLIKKTK